MSNPPNIKLMNRSCFDRKRFAVLLHEDWAARRTRCLVTLAAGYLLLSAILTVSCLKAYSENATLLQTVPTDILEDKFAHLTDTATNQNAAFVTVTAFFFLFLIFTPWLWNAPIYNKGSTSGTCCSQPPRSRSPMVALYRSSFDFGRRSYYFGGRHHPCHHLQHGLPGLQLRPSPPLYFRTSYGLLRLCAQDAPHDQSVGPSHFHQKRNGTDTPAPRTRQMPNPVVAPPFDDRSLAHCRRRPLHLPPTARSSDCRSGMACLLACRDLPLLAIGLPQNEKERPQIPICPQSEKRMNFKENKPIYLQIADRICDEILQGRYAENDRIPSVRDYAATVEVNANTAMRSYDFLQSRSVIRMQRGIGYFVEPGASERIRSFRRVSFMNEELYDFFRQARSIGITAEELETLYRQYLSDTSDTMSNL